MPLVSVKNVNKAYKTGATEVHALRGVDLDLETGEFTAIAGPSGSGKTTLLNIIGGLDTISDGSVVVADQDISGLKPRQLHELRLYQIGFVFQAYNLIPVLTACENVEFTMLLQGVPRDERRRRATEILDRVGLTDQMHRRPAAMSGGQQQRVAVARAIVTKPRIVLADEPTANLDSQTGTNLMAVMKQLNEEEAITFLFSTHDQMVMSHARRLIRLHDGRVESDTTA